MVKKSPDDNIRLVKEIGPILKQIASDAIKAYTEITPKKLENEKIQAEINKEANRNFMIYSGIILSLCLTTIVILAFGKIIEAPVIAGLLGGIIGYLFGERNRKANVKRTLNISSNCRGKRFSFSHFKCFLSFSLFNSCSFFRFIYFIFWANSKFNFLYLFSFYFCP